VSLAKVVYPKPNIHAALKLNTQGEEDKVARGLAALHEEDPTFLFHVDSELHQTVISAQGELHLEVLVDRLKRRFKVDVELSEPKVRYRETTRGRAESKYRHKKQTGGAGQFGEVYLRVEPLERGQGFEFVDEVVGGAIPSQFIPAVEKGVRQILGEGAIAGFPLQDLRVIVYDGKYHAVDSKEVAFVSAGRRAFLNGFREAGPIVLEPVVRIEVTTPTNATGDITGDLATRRGRVSGTQALAGQRNRISALVPLAEITDYQARVKSLTGGEGTFTMELSHYDPVPARKQQELMKAFKHVEEE